VLSGILENDFNGSTREYAGAAAQAFSSSLPSIVIGSAVYFAIISGAAALEPGAPAVAVSAGMEVNAAAKTAAMNALFIISR